MSDSTQFNGSIENMGALHAESPNSRNFQILGAPFNAMVQKQIAFEKIEQQQEALTLSDISPKWAKRLEELQQEPSPRSITRLRWWFEIIYPPKCVVGEAHDFTRSYTYSCRECSKIGDKFSLYYTLHLYSKLEENKHRFVNHWNKEHA